jgi:hypothetical protein
VGNRLGRVRLTVLPLLCRIGVCRAFHVKSAVLPKLFGMEQAAHGPIEN